MAAAPAVTPSTAAHSGVPVLCGANNERTSTGAARRRIGERTTASTPNHSGLVAHHSAEPGVGWAMPRDAASATRHTPMAIAVRCHKYRVMPPAPIRMTGVQ